MMEFMFSSGRYYSVYDVKIGFRLCETGICTLELAFTALPPNVRGE